MTHSGSNPAGIDPAGINPARRKGQRGQTVVIFTILCSLLLIPVAGLGIDGAIMYMMKGKLSAAVDAAALATARGLNAGATLQAQESSATATGNTYFYANLPTGTMRATVTNLSITFPTPTIPNTMVVQVQATISVPLTFMRLLRFYTANLSDTGQATRRISNVILVLDRSYSLQLGSQCGNLVNSAQQFVNYFVDGLDTMGLVDFQASANEDFVAVPNKPFKTAINGYIKQMQCSGYTNTAEALAVAYARLQTINQPSANNVIVLFTDGNADSVYSTFYLRKFQSGGQTDSLYNWSPVGNSNPSTTNVGNSPCPGQLNTFVSITGVMINLPGGLTSANDTGGVYQDTFYQGTPVPISWNSSYQTQGQGYPYPDRLSSQTGSSCATEGARANNDAYPTSSVAVRNDVAVLGPVDATPYQNSLVGYWTQAGDYYTSSSVYSGYLRVDTTQAVNDAALSDADNMAKAIRTGSYNNTTSPITATIYTIGLGNPPYETVNSTFLQRIANDPSAGSGYNSSQPTGMYIYCTPAGLQSAFVAIASQILRLSQ